MERQEEIKNIEKKLRIGSYFGIPGGLLIGLALNARLALEKDIWISTLQDTTLNNIVLVIGGIWIIVHAIWMLPLALKKKKLTSSE